MKIKTVVEKFKGSEKVFRCPVCKETFSLLERGSFVCQNGHCFDLSSKGYIHFLAGGGNADAQYDSELFAHRNAVFRDGFYEPAAKLIAGLAEKYLPTKKRVILDAGCGEGYYSHFLRDKTDTAVYGLDNSKAAILAATKNGDHSRFMIADLANMPVLSGCAGLVLNILTPANYAEFARVLCDDGAVIKAIPGERYLRELRECIFSGEDYSNEKTIGHMERNARIAEQKTIEYTLRVTNAQLSSFYKMTPMTTHAHASEKQLAEIESITIHMELFVLYPRKR